MRANPDLLALWFAYALMLFSMAAMGPVLGEVKDEFNLTPATTALLVAVQGMGRGGFMLVLAPLADRMSPRLLLPLGLLITGLASIVTAAAPSEWVFGVGIVASAAGSGLVGPGGQVHLVRRGQGEERRRNIARVMSGGMFHITQWTCSSLSGSSWLSIISARVTASAGTPSHMIGGDMLGTLADILVQVCFLGMRFFSLKTGLVNVMDTSTACDRLGAGAASAGASASPPEVSAAAAGAASPSSSLEQPATATPKAASEMSMATVTAEMRMVVLPT